MSVTRTHKSFREVESFPLLVKPVSQRESTQVHDIDGCYTVQCVVKPVSQWRCETGSSNHYIM